MNYHVLIPAYNAEKSIGHLIDKLREVSPPPQSVIVVDDGSADRTNIIATEHNATVLRSDKNHGKGHALITGFDFFLNKTSGDYLLCLDADLQHPPELAHTFLQAAQQSKAEYVIGNRPKSLRSMPFHRIMSNRITSWLMSGICGQEIADSQCGYRLLHRNIIATEHYREKGFQLESEMIINACQKGIKIAFVPIPAIYNGQQSSISNFKDTARFIRLILRKLKRKP